MKGEPFWLWMNLLSLDAPVVALVWQDFLARCYAPVLQPSARWVLGLTVWAIYMADRLLDVRHPAAEHETSRHTFYRDNRVPARVLLVAVLLADLSIAVAGLQPAVFSNGLPAGAGVFCYLGIFAFRPVRGRRWKQLSAAILFTTGVFLAAWTQTPRAWSILGWPAAAFCALCLGNLVSIERWEQGVATRGEWLWMTLLASLCAAGGYSRWYAGVALGAAAVAVLDFRSEKLSDNARRVLADAALLTPLLFR